MCGIAGIIIKPQERPAEQWRALREIVTTLLLANESRGPYATGIATIALDGGHRLAKRALPAREFVREEAYSNILGDVHAGTTVIMGHTRWPTVGPLSPENNQPIRVRDLVATHNGHISNHYELAQSHGFERNGEVDSEVLFRLALERYRRRGWLASIAAALDTVEGTLATVLVSRKAPSQVVLLRRGKPLALAWLPEFQALAYSSEFAHLHAAIETHDWRRRFLADGTGGRVNVLTLPSIARKPLAVPAMRGFRPNRNPWSLIP